MSFKRVPDINLFADGGAEPNPGKGGFGVIISSDEGAREFSKGFKLTTNNRMELMGVIYGLEQIEPNSNIHVYSDSRYVVDGISKGWAEKWKLKNWYRTINKKAINSDLWEKLLDLIDQQNKVTFSWIRGHNGHHENERCDKLAQLALNSNDLFDDKGYIYGNENKKQVSIPNPINRIASTNCRKCNTTLIKKPRKDMKLKPNQEYYYEYSLLCPRCKTQYLVERAKRFIKKRKSRLTEN